MSDPINLDANPDAIDMLPSGSFVVVGARLFTINFMYVRPVDEHGVLQADKDLVPGCYFTTADSDVDLYNQLNEQSYRLREITGERRNAPVYSTYIRHLRIKGLYSAAYPVPMWKEALLLRNYDVR